MFSTLYHIDIHKPRVEPTGYRCVVPVFKLVEQDSDIYLVTYLRQYDNATIVNLQTESHDEAESVNRDSRPRHVQWTLQVDGFETYHAGGHGSTAHMTHQFVVTPALPDAPAGFHLAFTWRKFPSVEAQHPDNFQDGTVVIELA